MVTVFNGLLTLAAMLVLAAMLAMLILSVVLEDKRCCVVPVGMVCNAAYKPIPATIAMHVIIMQSTQFTDDLM
jgi:hypothetical protein